MKRDEYNKKDLEALWMKHQNVSLAADEIGVSRKTLWRWYKDLGIDTPRGKYRPTTHPDWGKFASWLRKNKEPLPRSAGKLAEMSGCSKHSVEQYLYRRRLVFKQKVTTYMSKFFNTHSKWPDGSKIVGMDYDLEVDLWARTATISPHEAEAFTIGTSAPDGYKRKKKENR